MESTRDTRGPSGPGGPGGGSELETELRRLGFDLTRPVYLTYQVGAGSWDQANAIARDARPDGWRGSIYVDRTCWVVRLTQLAAPTRPFVAAARGFVDDLAARHGGRVRGFSAEDAASGDCWDRLAAQLVEVEHDRGDEAEQALRSAASGVPAQDRRKNRVSAFRSA